MVSTIYKQRLTKLKLLPLMYTLEITDIMFLVSSIKVPSVRFNILDYVEVTDSNTRSSDKLSLNHIRSNKALTRNYYFSRIPRLWNKLPSIDLSQSLPSIKTEIYDFFWSHFVDNFISSNLCTYHFLCPCSKCSLVP